MFHLHGEAAGRTPVSALLQAMLLPVHPAVADGAAAAVPALPRQPSPTRAGQLPMGRGGHAAARHAAAGRGPPAAAGHRERQVRQPSREAECVLLDLRQMHLPSVCTLGWDPLWPHFQAVRRGLRATHHTDQGGGRPATEEVTRAGVPRPGSGEECGVSTSSKGRACSGDSQRR